MGGMLEYTKDKIEGSSSGTINGIEREPKVISDNYHHMKYFKLIIKDMLKYKLSFCSYLFLLKIK